jgi:hypothetical protein
LLLVGLVFATWHTPLIFLAPVAANFPRGNLLLFFPLFYGTFVAASFFFGYLRIYTGSIWPASIAHAVHNAAWNVLGAVTLITAAPVLVDVYLVGDFGLLILIGTAIGAIWVGHRFKGGMNQAQSGAEVPRVAPAPPQSRRPPPGSHERSLPNLTTTKNGTASQGGMPSRACQAVLFTRVRGRIVLRSWTSALWSSRKVTREPHRLSHPVLRLTRHTVPFRGSAVVPTDLIFLRRALKRCLPVYTDTEAALFT